ncbi:uncharacterized protein LOC119106022 [Pollicipes pollicipes]|uniref:uncharacterized protein LOC119106022 n=1 Tax=Pollicipes pollicipes TaxID=41117 RepID=UPI001884CF68|nr:uncharacterized protein LOC119106022 [Pollicipes pollicipes]
MMTPLSLACILFVACFSGEALAAPPGDLITKIASNLGCGVPSDVNACVLTKFRSLMDKSKQALIEAAQTKFGGVGSDPISKIAFPEKTVGPVTVSGSDISVAGLTTLHVDSVELSGNSVQTTLKLGKMVIKGQFAVKYGPLKQEIPSHDQYPWCESDRGSDIWQCPRGSMS